MYAVIQTGGKQYKVTNDEVIFIEKLDAEAHRSLRVLRLQVKL